MKRRDSLFRWAIWILASTFFFYEFVMRVYPSVMVASLMHAFHIDAELVGTISGLYFYIYAPMQIPVGVLMDRYGARKLLTCASFVVGVGGILFGLAPTLSILALSRLLIGAGSAFAFVGLVYITSHLFPRRQIALLIGLANSLAMVGAAMGEGPISVLEDFFGWRQTIVGLGIFGLVLSLLIFWVIHTAPANRANGEREAGSFKKAIVGLRTVLKDSQSWLNAVISFALYATTAAFAALWGVPFLEVAHGLSRDVAGFATSIIYIGWLIGGPTIGHLSDRLRKRKPFFIICSILALLSILPILYLPGLSFIVLLALLFLVGFFSSAELLSFSYVIELHPQEATGSAVAFTNFIVMLGGALFQPLVGGLLDLFWDGTYQNGIQAYSLGEFQMALTCFPLTFLLAFVLAFFLKPRQL